MFDLGTKGYIPDFYLLESDTYIEIKGYWRKDALVKFNLFKNKYSSIKIKVLMKKHLKKERII
jgi:predicted nuclease of restriction endonuclease-like RecB superfamily